MGFSGGSVVKTPPANAGDVNLIPGSRRFPGEGNDNPLQYSSLGNPVDREAWWATVHGVIKEPYLASKKQQYLILSSIAEFLVNDFIKPYLPSRFS